MITGAHVVLFSSEPEATRELFRDVLGLPSVDAGGGFAAIELPGGGELGIYQPRHPIPRRED